MINQKIIYGILIVLDVFGFYAAYQLAYRLRFDHWPHSFDNSLWILMAVVLVIFYVMNVYKMEITRDPVVFSLDALIATIGIAVLSVVVVYVFGVDRFRPIFGRGVLPVVLLLFSIWACSIRWLLANWFQKSNGIVNWLVISEKEIFEEINKGISGSFLNSGNQKITLLDHNKEDAIRQWINQNPNRPGIVYNNQNLQENEILALREADQKIPVFSVQLFYETFLNKLPVEFAEKDWLLPGEKNLLNDEMGLRIKRVLDLIFAFVATLICLPIMIIIGILIYGFSPGKAVIYRQKRVGLNGREFVLYKFRSMVPDAESQGAKWSEENDPRITKLGGFLRSTRLDELPQLCNLILGNMSLIGPRPERPEFTSTLQDEIPFYEMRHVVPPGITGWAQVRYPYGSSVEDAKRKLEYDLFYIKNHSIRLDFIIVIKTLYVVLTRKGR